MRKLFLCLFAAVPLALASPASATIELTHKLNLKVGGSYTFPLGWQLGQCDDISFFKVEGEVRLVTLVGTQPGKTLCRFDHQKCVKSEHYPATPNCWATYSLVQFTVNASEPPKRRSDGNSKAVNVNSEPEGELIPVKN